MNIKQLLHHEWCPAAGRNNGEKQTIDFLSQHRFKLCFVGYSTNCLAPTAELKKALLNVLILTKAPAKLLILVFLSNYCKFG